MVLLIVVKTIKLFKMEFKKYQHLERFGTTEVNGIENGLCYIFPKIDGTNASIWYDGKEIKTGSRKRLLDVENDNAGFCKWVQKQTNILEYFKQNPTHRLFGEWLVPHSLKTYSDDAWRKFYVFDVVTDRSLSEMKHELDEKFNYLPFDKYSTELSLFNIDFIEPLAIIDQPNFEQIIDVLKSNTFLIKPECGVGEGIVVKNYDFQNKFGRKTFAKIISDEFKHKQDKNKAPEDIYKPKMTEELIVEKYITKSFCDKEFNKIQNSDGWTGKMIPRLIETIFHEFVKEETYNFIKEFKNPTVDFKTLRYYTTLKTKEHLSELF